MSGDTTEEESVGDLQHRHEDVPPDYYERGIRSNIGQRIWHRRRLSAIHRAVQMLPNPHLILDLGCHSGWMTEHLRVWTNAEVHGVDFSKTALAYGRTAHPAIHFRYTSLDEPFPYPDETFDLVTAFDVFEHLPDVTATLREVHRVLRPGGYVLLTIPAGRLFQTIWALWTRFGGAVWHDLHRPETTDHFLLRAFPEAGFGKPRHWTSHGGMYHFFLAKRRETV